MSESTPPLLPLLDDLKAGSIHSLNKKELQTIVIALGVLTLTDLSKRENTRDKLREYIDKALLKPEVASDARFQKFIVHRFQKAALNENSADKTVNDLRQGKEDLPATGANKKLLEVDSKSDPPPQFAKLGGSGAVLSDDDESVLSSSHSSPTPDVDDKVDERPVTPTKSPLKEGSLQDSGDPCLPIGVRFLGPNPREVWINANELEVTKNVAGNYVTSFKKLLPMAISRDSPLKGNGKAKISVTGKSGGHISLGPISQFVEGPLPQVLDIPVVDECRLRLADGGMTLEADVFWSDSSTGTVPNPFSQLGPDTKPLEVARARAAVAKAEINDDDDELQSGDEFILFLRQELNAREKPYPQLNTIGQMVERYRALLAAMKTCDEKYDRPSKGGFRIPDDHPNERFRGRQFLKNHIQQALHIRHAIAGKDAKYFKHDVIKCDPAAVIWVGESKGGSTFKDLSPKEWLEHLAYMKEAAAASKSESKGKGKRTATDEQEEEKERKRKRKKEKREKSKEGDKFVAGSSKSKAGRKDSEDLDSSR
ncbi:hypothetical protein C8J57DRAFT_1724413 [Mycena rebaudengoi]|nr:hypothetical protein C8J57DRAFT_1724413 [Mycena rebaudengoi]